jgi:hypothetical protein
LTLTSGSASLAGELRIAPANSSTGTVSLIGGQLTVTNYQDIGGATNLPSRFYRVRLVP